MASKLTNRPLVRVGLVVAASALAFVAVNRFMATAPLSPAIAPVIVETPSGRTARLEREQLVKDWQAAQKRADARDSDNRARHASAGETAAAH